MLSPFMFPLQCTPSDALSVLNQTLYFLHIHLYLTLKARRPLIVMILSWKLSAESVSRVIKETKKTTTLFLTEGFIFVSFLSGSYPC